MKCALSFFFLLAIFSSFVHAQPIARLLIMKRWTKNHTIQHPQIAPLSHFARYVQEELLKVKGEKLFSPSKMLIEDYGDPKTFETNNSEALEQARKLNFVMERLPLGASWKLGVRQILTNLEEGGEGRLLVVSLEHVTLRTFTAFLLECLTTHYRDGDKRNNNFLMNFSNGYPNGNETKKQEKKRIKRKKGSLPRIKKKSYNEYFVIDISREQSTSYPFTEGLAITLSHQYLVPHSLLSADIGPRKVIQHHFFPSSGGKEGSASSPSKSVVKGHMEVLGRGFRSAKDRKERRGKRGRGKGKRNKKQADSLHVVVETGVSLFNDDLLMHSNRKAAETPAEKIGGKIRANSHESSVESTLTETNPANMKQVSAGDNTSEFISANGKETVAETVSSESTAANNKEVVAGNTSSEAVAAKTREILTEKETAITVNANAAETVPEIQTAVVVNANAMETGGIVNANDKETPVEKEAGATVSANAQETSAEKDLGVTVGISAQERPVDSFFANTQNLLADVNESLLTSFNKRSEEAERGESPANVRRLREEVKVSNFDYPKKYGKNQQMRQKMKTSNNESDAGIYILGGALVVILMIVLAMWLILDFGLESLSHHVRTMREKVRRLSPIKNLSSPAPSLLPTASTTHASTVDSSSEDESEELLFTSVNVFHNTALTFRQYVNVKLSFFRSLLP